METEDDDEDYYQDSGGDLVDEGEGQLDAKGRLIVEFEVPQADEAEEWDYTYRLEAQVTDASRRQMEASAGFIGTRGASLAFAQPERYIYYQGDQARINVRAGNYLGQAVAAKVTLKFIEQRWEKVEKESNGYKYAEYKSRERELSTAEVETNIQGEAIYHYVVPSSGNIYIKAIIHENGKEVAHRT